MLGMVCTYNRWLHRIVHPRFEKWLIRECPPQLRDTLFVYFHLQARNFVVAHWVAPCRLFRDIYCVGPTLAEFDVEAARQMRIQLKSPVGGHQLAQHLRQQDRDRISRMQEENDRRRIMHEEMMSTKLKVSFAGS